MNQTKYTHKQAELNADVTIRSVRPGDEQILAYIQTDSWKNAFAYILPKDVLERCTDIHKAEAMYTTLLNDHIGNGLILSVDGEPHCIAFWDKSRDNAMPDYAELIAIHSLQQNWRKGYGAMMLTRVLSEMSTAGFKQAMLWVFKENTRACHFYEKHGFSLTAKQKDFYSATEVMYCKSL